MLSFLPDDAEELRVVLASEDCCGDVYNISSVELSSIDGVLVKVLV